MLGNENGVWILPGVWVSGHHHAQQVFGLHETRTELQYFLRKRNKSHTSELTSYGFDRELLSTSSTA